MILFRELHLDEFMKIRNDELEILAQLQFKDEYILDEHGDIMFDNNGNPIVDPTIIAVSTSIQVSSANRFAPFLNGHDIGNVVPNDIIDGYQDVFGIDLMFMRRTDIDGYDTKIIAMFENNVYQGCVWIFRTQFPMNIPYTGIYGIRASILNTLTGKRGSARAIIGHIIGTSNDRIVIPWPLESMRPLLTRMGFEEHNVDILTPERQFLAPIACTRNYWTYDAI